MNARYVDYNMVYIYGIYVIRTANKLYRNFNSNEEQGYFNGSCVSVLKVFPRDFKFQTWT